MKKYRKTDQEYIDEYDRYTIKRLKEIEKDLNGLIYYREPLKDIPNKEKTPGMTWDDSTLKFSPNTVFFDTAVKQAQNKEASILLSKRTDENRDRIIMQTPVPRNIKCATCDCEMDHEGHLFKEDDTLVLFVFTCPNQHPPRRAIYPDGKREWAFKKSTCKKCGGDFESKTQETDRLMIFTDTCIGCGDIEIMELEIPEPDPQIDEAERKKYCTEWKGKKTFVEALEEISDFMKLVKKIDEEKQIKEVYSVDKVERLNVPPLETRLSKAAEELGFTKFKFESTSTKGFVIVSFSAQDPSDRAEKASIKDLSNAIKKSIFPTNWRLMSDGINYRLGVLNGRLKAFEDDDGLLKIAKEIHGT